MTYVPHGTCRSVGNIQRRYVMFAHVVVEEIERLMSRKRYWLLAAVLSGILVYQISVVSPGYANPPSASAAFIYTFKENLAGFCSFVTGLAVGDSFAIDRSTSLS